MWWELWVWTVLGSSLNGLIEKAWGEGTVSSLAVVLLKVVESCWVYFEESVVFLKGDVPLRSITNWEGVGSPRLWSLAKMLWILVNRTKCWNCRRFIYEIIEKDKTQGTYRVLIVVSNWSYSICRAAVKCVIRSSSYDNKTLQLLLLRIFLDSDGSPPPATPA